jgi:pantetheine-phosphate adenylyltransferase
MSFLILTYQALTNHNHLLQYMIIPSPISMVICDKHKKLALGGTFDNIHSGHYLLLTYARMLVHGELIVGITGPEMLLKKKNQQFVQSYWTREQNVRRFLQRMGGADSMRLFMLPDGYGPTITEGDITGLVVTK